MMGHGSASVDGTHDRADFCGLMVWPYASRPWRGSRRPPARRLMGATEELARAVGL